MAIVGPSGCDKTTLLRILAGLDHPDAGEALIDGHPVQGVGTERAIIFQESRLVPWPMVLGNVAFGLTVCGLTPSEPETRTRHYIRLVGLADFEAAHPRQHGRVQGIGLGKLACRLREAPSPTRVHFDDGHVRRRYPHCASICLLSRMLVT